jgi:hypothetical protein
VKHRKYRQMQKRLEERRRNFKPTYDAPRGAFTEPGSQNPHKGRWGSSRRHLR